MTFDVPAMVLVQITGTSLTQDCPQGNERDLVYMKVGRFSGKECPEWNNETNTQFLTLSDAIWTFTDDKVYNYQDPRGTLVAVDCIPGPVREAFTEGFFGITRLENMSSPVWVLEKTHPLKMSGWLFMRGSFETFATATTTVLGKFVTNDDVGYNKDYMMKVTKQIIDPAQQDLDAKYLNCRVYPATVRSIADMSMVKSVTESSITRTFFIVSDLDTLMWRSNVIPSWTLDFPRPATYTGIQPISFMITGSDQIWRGAAVSSSSAYNYAVTFMMKVPGGSDLSKYTPYVQKYAPAPVQLQYVLPE